MTASTATSSSSRFLLIINLSETLAFFVELGQVWDQSPDSYCLQFMLEPYGLVYSLLIYRIFLQAFNTSL